MVVGEDDGTVYLADPTSLAKTSVIFQPSEGKDHSFFPFLFFFFLCRVSDEIAVDDELDSTRVVSCQGVKKDVYCVTFPGNQGGIVVVKV